MKKPLFVPLGIVTLAVMTGCVTSTGLYDYGSYSKRQYHMAKLQTPEATAEYEAEILRLIEKARANGRRPAPGLLAEYGYLQALKGDSSTAETYFQEELSFYPEAQGYIDFLRQMLNINRSAA